MNVAFILLTFIVLLYVTIAIFGYVDPSSFSMERARAVAAIIAALWVLWLINFVWSALSMLMS